MANPPGPPPDISLPHALHLNRFAYKLRVIEGKPEQGSHAINQEKSNFFNNSCRSMTVAFGWPDTLKNKVAREDSDWDYEHIPSLPELSTKAEEEARRADMSKLKVVRAFGLLLTKHTLMSVRV